MTNLDVALRYAKAGFKIFPCGTDKRPLVSSWATEATTDPAQIRALWKANPEALVGLPMKPHYLLVFDADRHHEGEDGVAHLNALCSKHGSLPPHPIVLTANGGEHHIFEQPEKKIGNRKLGNGLETRGYKDDNDGGYIIAAGSKLPDGRCWRLANGTPSLVTGTQALYKPPEWLTEYASEQREEQRQIEPNFLVGKREEAYAAKALDNLARELAAMAPESGRNDRLNIAALKLGSMVSVGWIGEATITGRLLDACASNGLVKDTGAKAVHATIQSGLKAGLAQPHAALPEREVMRESKGVLSYDVKAEQAERQTLEQVHTVFRKWLGNDYDIGALNAVLAVAASEKLSGDPAWLLMISGPGNAKTETCQSLSKLDAHIISTISSEGALLSGTSDKQRSKGATGGLLRKIGDRGLLIVKDFTSILSANRDTRASVLAALREIHDGNWTRNVGTDGGKTLTWSGRVVLIGACTTAWDQAHAVIAAMGDRFVLVRSDSSGAGRVTAGKKAIRNTGIENVMRKELSEAVAGLIGHMSTNQLDDITDDQVDQILEAANIVTLARTGVEIDYRGDVIDAHAPEMPTRFARQLTQVLRGARAIGMGPSEAMDLVIRCARDSMPPLRLAILEDIGKHPDSRRLQRPRATADRALQALHVLGLLTCREEEDQRNDGPRYVRHYSLNPTVNLNCLYQICQYSERRREDKGAEICAGTGGGSVPPDISGTGPAPHQRLPSTPSLRQLRPSCHDRPTLELARAAGRHRPAFEL